MILVRICWYLCVVCLVSDILMLCMSVTPDSQRFLDMAMLVAFVLAILSALSAILLKRKVRNDRNIRN